MCHDMISAKETVQCPHCGRSEKLEFTSVSGYRRQKKSGDIGYASLSDSSVSSWVRERIPYGHNKTWKEGTHIMFWCGCCGSSGAYMLFLENSVLKSQWVWEPLAPRAVTLEEYNSASVEEYKALGKELYLEMQESHRLYDDDL